MNEAPASARLSADDAASLAEVRRLAAFHGAGVAPMLAMLSRASWAVRRVLVTELARLGSAATEPLCESLRNDRSNESRVAAVVDALVGSVSPVDDTVRELLRSTDLAVICDALQILGRRGHAPSVPDIVAFTAHADDNVAVAAIEALGRIGGPEAVECLAALLQSRSFFRSFPAIDVLGRLGDTAAVAPLMALLGDPLLGAEAARALGRLGDETASSALIEVLASGKEATLRVAALALFEIHGRMLQRFGTGAPLERALLSHPKCNVIESRIARALASADATEKIAISKLLGFFSAGEAVEKLFTLLDDSEEVAKTAASSLGRLAHAGNTDVLVAARTGSSRRRELLLPELAGLLDAAPFFVECLRDPDARVRVLACDALAKTGDTSAAPALFDALGGGDLGVSQAAAAALQALGSAETEALALGATSHPKAALRQAGLRLLAYFGSRKALPVLLAAANDEDPRVREIAIGGLALSDDARGHDQLLASAQHPVPRTRAAALRALGAPGAEADTVELLKAATNDEDPWVRYYACQALGHTGDIEAARVLTSHIEDPAGQVRVAAVDALARLSGPPALETLARAAAHEDVDVRRAALVGIGLTQDRALLPLLREAVASPDAATRLVAISSLARYPDDSELAVVAHVAKSDPDANVQNAAIELLAESTRALASEALVELLADAAVRERATLALARHGAARLPVLLGSLQHAAHPVAESLAALVARLPAGSSEGPLLDVLDSPSAAARRAAARALSFLYDSERVRAKLAHAASADADPEVRRICATHLS